MINSRNLIYTNILDLTNYGSIASLKNVLSIKSEDVFLDFFF